MKTELSHNEIALYKSEKIFILFYDHLILFLPYFILPIALLLFLSPITSSLPTYSSLPPPNVLSC